MDLVNFRMLIHELLNNYPYIVPDGLPLFIFDSESDVWMAENGKDIKHNRHIDRRVNFVRNGDKCKMHKIGWCEGGMQLEDIATNNVGENDLNPRIKNIMVRLDNC